MSGTHDRMGERRFGAVNWLGLTTLAKREVMRFVSVYTQTILAPVATAGLFMLVFTLAFGRDREGLGGVAFEVFLAPGILMMTVIQNAFANTSSSLMISKVQGNIVDTLMPPLGAGEILTGYVVGGVARGAVCAVAVAAVLFPVVGVGVAHPAWAVVFVGLASVMLSLIGLLAAIQAQKFDQLAAITNFVVTPLSFLSGTFYSITALPPSFQALSHANPFFYLIDGFRFGTIGVSDTSPWIGLAVGCAATSVLWLLAWHLLRRGYRLKS